MKIYFFLPLLTLYLAMRGDNPTVYVYTNNSRHAGTVLSALNKFDITFEITQSVIPQDDQHLYILFDAFTLNRNVLPKYYITYQTLNLTNNQLTNEYLNTLSNSIAVWDYNVQNVTRYRSRVSNWLYFPENYEFEDPTILPCRLPLSMLSAYKELLSYSNQKDTDISSVLPALFCHTVLQNPKIIVEAGVRGGESTKPLAKAAVFCGATLIGLDVEASASKAYQPLNNSLFLLMDDLKFDNYYNNSEFRDKGIDLVFIDTTHEYKQTLAEIALFEPLLSEAGTLSFHDSNVTPLPNAGYVRLNGSRDYAGGNPRGVPQAIKEYFNLEFDEYHYFNGTFTRNGAHWHITHYPFCNGLTIIQKIPCA